MTHRWDISSAEGGKRIDTFIAGKLADVSRSHIQKDIVAGNITVNGSQVKKHYALQDGDSIEYSIVEKDQIEKIAIDIPILHEDEHILVIEKPCGVLVHPAHDETEWTLADFARDHGASSVGDDPARPGIVHRLDRDVSGVMVITKTQEAFAHLKAQFQDRSVQKEYRAIVHGVPSQEYGIIKFKIARGKTHGGRMAARPENAEGQDAWTEYSVLSKKHSRYAELSVQIKTGRTHQIRVHLAAIDHPVVGDTLYFSSHYSSKKTYPRVLLHAHTLAFVHPYTQEAVIYTSEIPSEFAEMMQP